MTTSQISPLSEEQKQLSAKYHRVADTQDGFDVLLDILLTLYWRGTLLNDSQVALHNVAEEIVAKFGGIASGADWQDTSMRNQLRSAILTDAPKSSLATDYPTRPTDGGI